MTQPPIAVLPTGDTARTALKDGAPRRQRLPFLTVVRLTQIGLEALRDRLRSRGERPSVVMTRKTSAEVMEAMQIVTEYGPMCEALFLVMLADGRVKNVERDVLRGALRVLSNDRVRSTHMESMLDAASRNVADQGVQARLADVVEKLKNDPAKAETTYVLAAAIAAADDKVVPEEVDILNSLADGLGIDEARVNKLLADLESGDASDAP
jgi:tellurite resistance protein